MSSTKIRVTVTLPAGAVREIDRLEKNRSRFMVEAVQNELDRRRRAEFRRSLENPHPGSEELAEIGFDDWAARLGAEPAAGLVDPAAGRSVRWLPGKGWTEIDD